MLLALRRHWVLLLIPVVIFTAVGFQVGRSRAPVFTARASLIIGTADPASANFGGNVVAASSLATAYSRAIVAASVVNTVSRQMHLSGSVVTSSLSSAPIPSSPEFDIVGTGSSSSQAVAITNSATNAVLSYVNALGSHASGGGQLLSSYQAAANKLARDTAAYDAAVAKGDRAGAAAAAALKSRDQLVVTSIGQSYTAALAANPPTTGVHKLTTAFAATSDRKSKIELLGFIGFVVGLVVGSAIAMLRGTQEVRRARRLIVSDA
jgi:capsular polysaccharide biosynthesis protein